MANDNIIRKLNTLREAARYDCGCYIRELIDDLAEAILAKPEGDNIHCPVCGSANTEGDYTEFGDNDCWQFRRCNECGAHWTDYYTFTGNEYIEKGDER